QTPSPCDWRCCVWYPRDFGRPGITSARPGMCSMTSGASTSRRQNTPSQPSPASRARYRHAPGGMLQHMVAAKEVPPRHMKVRPVDEPTVLGDEPRALLAVASRKIVPGDARRLVVQGVQIVEEKQRS